MDWIGISASSAFLFSLLWCLSFTLGCTLAGFDFPGYLTVAGDNSELVPDSFVVVAVVVDVFVVALVTAAFRGDRVSILLVGDV